MSHDPACHASQHSSCHPPKKTFDWLLWGSVSIIGALYGTELASRWLGLDTGAAAPVTRGAFEIMNAMWWGMGMGVIAVGLLGRIPQEFIVSILGQGGTKRGIVRATAAGVLLDLCSHGILMVGMRLYHRGASLGQIMAFLIASPWNSISLTFILIALIGWQWTLAFILGSMAIALVSGVLFDRLVARGTLPANPNAIDLPADFEFWPAAKAGLKTLEISPRWIGATLWDGLKGSRMVIRWALFGVVLAVVVRLLMTPDAFSGWFGPTLAGLGLTLIAATIIEVCSEGAAPLAADLLTRAGAPGNSFAFLMTGVSTDYTEIMSIRDTMGSWKIALFLPMVTVPQVVLLGWLMNAFHLS